jgi:hypothetical protein
VEVTMRLSWTFAWVCLAGCGAGGAVSEGGSTSGATSTGGEPTTTTAPTSTGGTSGGPLACEPMPASIALAEFSQTMAAAICAQKEACGCEVDFACETPFVEQFDAVVAYAQENGIPYDGECAARLLFDRVTARGCLLASEDDSLSCDFCSIFQGAIAEGEACPAVVSWEVALYTEACAEPNGCLGETCAPPLPKLELGDPCADADGLLGFCPMGTACDSEGSKTCVEVLPAGADCSAGVCGFATFCNDSAVCEARRPVGEPCAAPEQCLSYYCPAGQGMCGDYVLICEIKDIGSLVFGPELYE